MPGSGSVRQKVWIWAVAVALVVSFSLGCTRNKAGGNSIKVGVVLPITGREAKPGQYQREGIDLAIKQINQNGGVMVKELGKKLPLQEVVYDDSSDQAKSASLAERAMSSDEVIAVLGAYSTALGEAESVMPDRYQTPWITTGAAATTIFNHGYQYTFGTLSPTNLLGSTTAEYLGSLVDQSKLKKGLKIAMAMGDGVDYIFAGIWWSRNLPYAQVKKFNEDYKAFTGHEPDSWYPATAYDAMRVLASAIESAGTLNKTAIRDALKKVDLKDSLLPGQELKFGANGQINTPFVIVQNKPGGKVDIVYPKDAATGESIAPIPKH